MDDIYVKGFNGPEATFYIHPLLSVFQIARKPVMGVTNNTIFFKFLKQNRVGACTVDDPVEDTVFVDDHNSTYYLSSEHFHIYMAY